MKIDRLIGIFSVLLQEEKTTAPELAERYEAMKKNYERAWKMKYPWIEEYLMEKPGVTKDLQKDWNWIRFQLAGKMFAAICLDDIKQKDTSNF